MPNTCAAYGCNYKFGPDTKQKGITFHLLPPPSDARRKLWISNSRRIDPVTRKPWDPQSKYVYFCSEHFMPSDFENAGKFGRRLKDNAVPTVFTFPTITQDSPVKQSISIFSGDAQHPSNADSVLGKHKLLSRPRKSKHRKVVMLPKKIKQLQETSPSNVESVTIISFQHLDYDEKLQPMFEEAMLDLQYPEDSEGDPEEEEEYYDDEYTELQAADPLEDDIPVTAEKTVNEEQVDNLKSMDYSESAPLESNEEETENNNESSEVVGTDTEANSTTLAEHVTETEEIDASTNTQTDIGDELQNSVPSSPKKLIIQSQPVHPIQREERTVVKRRIPVVIKELSLIDDIEELRTKAFKIAEDNVKLQKHVMYLEQKLEEVVTQINVK